VTIGARSEDAVEVLRGLHGGERVVTGGVENPKEGMRVKADDR
jgi:multidrug efflux pump subunit AcrA (membrane-fusion protein)